MKFLSLCFVCAQSVSSRTDRDLSSKYFFYLVLPLIMTPLFVKLNTHFTTEKFIFLDCCCLWLMTGNDRSVNIVILTTNIAS